MAQRPHLRILEIGMNYGYEVTNDALSIRGFQEYRCNDYHLGTVTIFVFFCIIYVILSCIGNPLLAFDSFLI